MSSYADVAAHGPQQTDADRSAPQVPQLVDHSTASTLPDDSHSVNVVTSDYKDSEIKTSTQEAQHKKDQIIKEMEKLQAEAKQNASAAKESAKNALDHPRSTLIAIGKDTRTYNLIDSVLVIAIGLAGYRRYKDGQLDVQTVGVGVLGLGLFAGVQTAIQQWFRKQ